jgi:hypothetical protein
LDFGIDGGAGGVALGLATPAVLIALTIAGIIQDQDYFDACVEPRLGQWASYVGPVEAPAARRPQRGHPYRLRQ